MFEYFIARQPIFDSQLSLFAYELLFRDSESDQVPKDFDQDAATAEVLNTSADIGLNDLVDSHVAFINLPQRFLLEPDLVVLPLAPEKVVLEVLETVEINADTIDGIRTLAERGFTLALDDVVDLAPYEQILPYFRIIKFEVPEIPRERWETVIEAAKRRGFQVLAEKIESNRDFEALVAMGCDLFQGFFFARPQTVTGQRLSSNKLALLQILAALNNPGTDIDKLSELVSHDVALSVRVLNQVNSAASSLNRQIDSVREAAVYLGRDTIRHLVMLFVMAKAEDRPSELLTMALQRARLCELIAERESGEDQSAYFTVGLFSVLDALLNAPMHEIVDKLAVTDEMRMALVSSAGPKGMALTLATALERADFDTLALSTIPGDELADLHQQAVLWADQILEQNDL